MGSVPTNPDIWSSTVLNYCRSDNIVKAYLSWTHHNEIVNSSLSLSTLEN